MRLKIKMTSKMFTTMETLQMMFNTPTILAFGLTFVLAIVAYYFYSLKQELLARLLHGGQEFDKLQKQMQKLSNDHEKVLSRQSEKNLSKNKTHKAGVADGDKYKLLMEQNQKTVEQHNKDMERFKNTEEHLRLQVQSLTEQLKTLSQRECGRPARPRPGWSPLSPDRRNKPGLLDGFVFRHERRAVDDRSGDDQTIGRISVQRKRRGERCYRRIDRQQRRR